MPVPYQNWEKVYSQLEYSPWTKTIALYVSLLTAHI